MTNEHGILLLNKAAGISSARALAAAKKKLQLKKAGHGGTLDPLACGLLVLLFGEATRYAQYLLAGDKQYIATIRFGYQSDSDDADGVITPTAPPPADWTTTLAALLPDFCGDISQTAPVYSALKHRGKPLYEYARRNIATPPKIRRVHISTIALHDTTADSATIAVSCGGGVYIRALARDIGAALGCGAYLTALQRTAGGGFHLSDAVTLEALENRSAEQCRSALLPIDNIVKHFPSLTLPDAALYKLGKGIKIEHAPVTDSPLVQVVSPDGRFAGLAEHRDGCYCAVRFLHWTRQPQ